MLHNLPEAHYLESTVNENLKSKADAKALANSVSKFLNPPQKSETAPEAKEADKATPAPARIAFGGCSD